MTATAQIIHEGKGYVIKWHGTTVEGSGRLYPTLSAAVSMAKQCGAKEVTMPTLQDALSTETPEGRLGGAGLAAYVDIEKPTLSTLEAD